jgi:hypothetical protein
MPSGFAVVLATLFAGLVSLAEGIFAVLDDLTIVELIS